MPLKWIKARLNRCGQQQETALWQMTNRMTIGERLSGYTKSERVEAKFLIFAILPFVPLMFSDEIGWARGYFWTVWFWLSAIWAIVVIGVGFAGFWRALRRSIRKDRDDS